jgi:hypothetical protein
VGRVREKGVGEALDLPLGQRRSSAAEPAIWQCKRGGGGGWVGERGLHEAHSRPSLTDGPKIEREAPRLGSACHREMQRGESEREGESEALSSAQG